MSTPSAKRLKLGSEDVNMAADLFASTKPTAEYAEEPADLIVVSPSPSTPGQQHDDEDKFPSFAVLSEEICKIASEKYSREDALSALKKIGTWAGTGNNVLFLQEFCELGGIPHLLNFLNKNLGDQVLMTLVAAALSECLYFDEMNGKLWEIAGFAAKQLVKRDGIKILLLANEAYPELDTPIQRNGLKDIWRALQNLSSVYTTHLSKVNLLAILDSALKRLDGFSKQVDSESKADMIESFTCIIQYVLSSDDIDKIDVDSKQLIPKCLGALKEGKLEYDDQMVSWTLGIFLVCSEKGSISRSGFERINLFCISNLEKFPAHPPICSGSLTLLEMGCKRVERGNLDLSGIHMAVAAVLQQHDAAKSVTDDVRSLMNTIYQ